MFGLDHSQRSAVLKCIATKECNHQNTLRLIWGPPGTGKTKTVASLLVNLRKMECRTLTCAPTNIAVLGVINRLMNLVRPTLELDTYGLGDIVLFGNGERMKIDDYEDLFDVFLDNRVSALVACLDPVSGWKGSMEAIIQLLENPEKLYQLYLKKEKHVDSDGREEQEDGGFKNIRSCGSQTKMEGMKGERSKTTERKALFQKVIAETVKDKIKRTQEKEASMKLKHSGKGKTVNDCKKTEVESSSSGIILWTFEEFVMKEFNKVRERLFVYLTSLYTHLPTYLIEWEVAETMIRVIDRLQTLGTLIHRITAANEGLREAFYGFGTARHRKTHFNELQMTRRECLEALKYLLKRIYLSKWIDCDVRTFCLSRATLIFCTVSSSAKLHTDSMTPLNMLIVDEAAQLKECESNIPLQLPGLRHAVLIGDGKQLPAMVQSKVG